MPECDVSKVYTYAVDYDDCLMMACPVHYDWTEQLSSDPSVAEIMEVAQRHIGHDLQFTEDVRLGDVPRAIIQDSDHTHVPNDAGQCIRCQQEVKPA